MSDYKEEAAERGRFTVKAFDAVARSFLPNPEGEAILAARVIEALNRSEGYAFRPSPRGSVGQNRSREMHNLIESRP